MEKRVYDLERRWATPVPCVTDREGLNAHLLRCCLAERELISGSHAETVGVRFERDRAAALLTSLHHFDACVLQVAQVDKYQTVRFDHNAYSVPRRWAFRAVTVKGYVDQVAVVAEGQGVAHHARCYGQGERILDPRHYLVTLERKPAALDHAPVYRDWQLPTVFPELRQALQERFGVRAGTRQFIRVLQLLAQHPLRRVAQAIAPCRVRGVVDAVAITTETERLAQAEARCSDIPVSLNDRCSDIPMSRNDRGMSAEGTRLAALHVPLPDLTQFNRLLSSDFPGDPTHDATDGLAAEGQSETTETADHARRVREAGA